MAFFALGVALLLIWLDRVWLIYQATGLFRIVGIDWALYAAQALVLRSGAVSSIYNLADIEAALQAFRVYTTDPTEPLAVGPVPYPAVFAALIAPFTLPAPPVGLALWTVVNLAGVLWLAKRVSEVLPRSGMAAAGLALLISAPIAQGLLVGQPTALLACAVAECYLSLRAGKDLRGGLWLATLLLKPQYGILIGPVLLWKRRWAAVLGVAIGAALLLGVSALVVGPSTLLTYSAALSDDAPFRGGAMTNPGQMINWRALILNLRPSIGPETGLLLTALAGVVTALLLVPLWRGKWSPDSPTFAAQFSATLLVTVLAGYHSHIHGAALMAVPLAATLAQHEVGRVARLAVFALAFGPTLLVVAIRHWLIGMLVLQQPLETLIWSPLIQILLAFAILALTLRVVRLRRAPSATPPPLLPPGDAARIPTAGAESRFLSAG